MVNRSPIPRSRRGALAEAPTVPEAALRTDTALSTPMPSRPTSGSGGSPGDFHGFWQEMGTFSGFFFWILQYWWILNFWWILMSKICLVELSKNAGCECVCSEMCKNLVSLFGTFFCKDSRMGFHKWKWRNSNCSRSICRVPTCGKFEYPFQSSYEIV